MSLIIGLLLLILLIYTAKQAQLLWQEWDDLSTGQFYQACLSFSLRLTGLSAGAGLLVYTLEERLPPVLLFIISLAAGVSFLSAAFSKIDILSQTKQSRFFYLTGIVLVGLSSMLLSDLEYQSYLGWGDLASVIIILFCAIIVGVVGSILLLYLWQLVSQRHQDFSDQPTPARPSKSMDQHYQDQGLTKDQVDFFRQEMSRARDLIYSIEAKFQETARLRAIEQKHNTIAISQDFFKSIVQEPNRLLEANDFLNQTLPSLEDLISKYNEINGHVAKNKQTYLILDKSAQTIDDLCSHITDEYIAFHKRDYDALEDEIELANRNLNKQDKPSSKDEMIDQLLKDLKED